jgi:phosphoserine phosphatase
MLRLVCFDMDGVIFESKNFWMDLHRAYGTYEQGLELTRKYLHSDYAKLVHEVVWQLWRGKDARIYEALVRQQRYIQELKHSLTISRKIIGRPQSSALARMIWPSAQQGILASIMSMQMS